MLLTHLVVANNVSNALPKFCWRLGTLLNSVVQMNFCTFACLSFWYHMRSATVQVGVLCMSLYLDSFQYSSPLPRFLHQYTCLLTKIVSSPDPTIKEGKWSGDG